MSTQGPLLCATAVDDATVGVTAWVNPGNVTASDDVRATANLAGGSSHYLKATNFSFTIPTGATIDNVEFRFERRRNGGTGITDADVRMVRNGTISSTNKSDSSAWPTSEAVKSYSFTPANWGESGLTVTNVNASNFGVVISGNGIGSAEIDAIDCVVTYTEDDESTSSSSTSSSSTSSSSKSSSSSSSLSSSSTSSVSSASSSSSSSTSSSSSSSSTVGCVPVRYADWVLETSVTTGTGTFSLDGAAAGYQAFSNGVGDQRRVCYSASDGTDYEVGIGTFRVGTPPTLTRQIILASSNGHDFVNWPAGDKNVGLVFPSLSRLGRGYMDGYVLSNNSGDASHDIDISAGICRDHCDQMDIESIQTVTKQIDATWAAGNNAGGRFAGVNHDPSTWYHLFAIYKDTGRLVDFGFDSDPDAIHRPAGYTIYRLLGSVLTDGSSNIVGFVHTTASGADWFRWKSPILDVDDTAVASSGETKTLSVPPGRRVVAVLNVRVDCPALSDDDEEVYFYNDEVTAQAAGLSAAPLGSLGFEQTTNTDGAENRVAIGQVLAATDTGSQIKIATRNGFGVKIATVGWLDARGRSAS